MVSFDTMVLIWGVKKEASTGQEYMIDRTTRFLQDLSDRRIHVALTALVVSEYLADFSKAQRPAQLDVLKEHFPILPFDLKAAEIAADLLYDKKLINKIRDEYEVSRQVVKADIAIIAAAVAAGAQILYSNDGKVRKAAQGKILVHEIPDLPEQQTLFGQ